MDIYIFFFLLAVSSSRVNAYGIMSVTQSTIESMNEASYGVDGKPSTYSRSSDRPGQYWKITLNQSYDISLVFIRIRGASANKMFHLFVNEDDSFINDTLCKEFSFNNTVINEDYIDCQKPMRGNTFTLTRDGEIRLFEFRPIVCDRETVYDILTNTSVKCSEHFLSVTRPTANKTIEIECPICEQIFSNLCNDPWKRKCQSVNTLQSSNVSDADIHDTMENHGSLWTIMLIGFGSLGGFILFLVPVIVIKYRGKKTTGNANDDIVYYEEIHRQDPAQINFQLQEEAVEYSNISTSRIPVEKFIQQVARKKVYDSFLEEFESLSNEMDLPSADAFNFNENREADYTKLMFHTTTSSEKLTYVNASFIDGFSKPNAYIAAQDPSSTETIGDMWELIWQNNCTRIVALTSDSEYEKDSSKYWPPTVNEIGSFFITVDKQDIYAHYTIRQLIVTKKSDRKKRKMIINHFHITSWQRRNIPECLDSLLCLRNLVKSGLSDRDGPVLVHCSKDCGQTGTYIALDYLIEEGLERGSIDMRACVLQLRQKISFFIQSCEEYMFLQEAVAQYFATQGSSSGEQ